MYPNRDLNLSKAYKIAAVMLGLCSIAFVSGCNCDPKGTKDITIPVDPDVPDKPDETKKPDKPVSKDKVCEPDKCEKGQVCAGADCCDPVDACGDACCASGDSCFAGRCVTPGKACIVGDCDDGAYCEMALSKDDTVVGDPKAGQTCQTGTSVAKGRCIALPTACNDGGESENCVHDICEFKPKDSPLRTKLLWSWGSDYVIPELPDESNFTAAEPKTVDGEPNPKFVKPTTFQNKIDVWSTAVVGRVTDTNCDGKVDNNDTPNIVVVSADTGGSGCQTGGNCATGVIRVLDGKSGRELKTVSVADAGSDGVEGFAGVTPVLANVDSTPGLDIIAVDSHGHINAFNVATEKKLIARSEGRIESAWNTANARNTNFGWGGFLSAGSDDADDHLLISFGGDIFVLKRPIKSKGGSIKKINSDTLGPDGRTSKSGAYFADIDPDREGLELITHDNIYAFNKNAAGDIVAESIWDGKLLSVNNGETWDDGVDRAIDLADYAFPEAGREGPIPEQIARFFKSGVADFDGDNKPEIVAVFAGYVFVFDAKTRVLRAPPYRIEIPEIVDRDAIGEEELGRGGSITIANMKDFGNDPSLDGTTFKVPEVGIALKFAYVTLRIQLDPSEQNVTTGKISMNWATPTFDTSSSETGATVFDFEGNGIAEVVYNDECFQWVFDGRDGSVKFAMPTQSFTGTESSILADVTGNGHAEIVMVSNGAGHISGRCRRDAAVSNGSRPGWFDATGVMGSSAAVVLPEHSTCSDVDNVYGRIPSKPLINWTLKRRTGEGGTPFLNNFRQNIQGEGRFDAADAAVGLRFQCDSKLTAVVTVQNKGRNVLPAGVRVGIYLANEKGLPTGKKLAVVSTTSTLASGQSTDLRSDLSGDQSKRYIAKLLLKSDDPLFVECQNDSSKQVAIDNNLSGVTTVGCISSSRLR